jgi:hypothetical protein
LAQVEQLSLLGVFVESTLGSSKVLLGLINIACTCLYSDLFRNLSEALCNRISRVTSRKMNLRKVEVQFVHG